MNASRPERQDEPRHCGESAVSLREGDQRTLAVLTLLVLLVLSTLHFANSFGDRRQVEFDQVPPQPLEFTVDVNTADWPEIMLLPDIGEVLAKRIIASRESEGPFRRYDDLRRVRGIGPKKLARIQPYLRFNPNAELVAEHDIASR